MRHLIHFIAFLIMSQIAYRLAYKERGKSSKHTIPAKMPFECIACGEPVTTRQEGIECDGCHCWQHRTCCPDVCRAEYRQAYRVGYMDGKCQECIAITSVVAMTIDLADLAISTRISVASASVAVAASKSAHPTEDATVHVAALVTAPVADGSLDIGPIRRRSRPSPNTFAIARSRSSGPSPSAQGD